MPTVFGLIIKMNLEQVNVNMSLEKIKYKKIETLFRYNIYVYNLNLTLRLNNE